MPRSIWKGPFVDYSVLKKLSQSENIIWSRRSVILPEFVDKTFFVYNGKDFRKLYIVQDMIGHKFGEFVATRKQAIHVKKK